MMSLADVYCRVNRARGLELLSPEDLLHACEQLSGPIRLRSFPSGARVLQLESHDDSLIAIGSMDAAGPLMAAIQLLAICCCLACFYSTQLLSFALLFTLFLLI